MLKTCFLCEEEKLIEQFPLSSNKPYRRRQCKVCWNKKKREKKYRKGGMSKEEWIAKISKPTTIIKSKLYENLKPKPGQTMAEAKHEAWTNSDYNKELNKKQREEAELKRKNKTERQCNTCKEIKPIKEFSIRTKTRPDGSTYITTPSSCKVCRNKKAFKYRKENQEVIRAYRKSPKRKADNKMRQKIKEIRKSHPAVPNWLTLEQKKEIRKLHLKQKHMRDTKNKEYHIDHIVPLNGETVCGLHVPWNLQLIPEKENLSKSNNWEFGCMYQYDKVSHNKENTIDKG